MKITTEKYNISIGQLPQEGRHIIGHQTDNEIVVYQAYKPSIAEYAVRHQVLGGSEYGYGRMSWIKPNFLWMMYRCGWAEKENQERVLAIWIDKAFLTEILSNAVPTSFHPACYPDREAWAHDLENKEVRLQWDPDHDPYGQKEARRAIQLGLKGSVLRDFGQTRVRAIEDVTAYVRAQKQHVDNQRLDLLEVPVERVWEMGNEEVRGRIGISVS